MSETTYWWSENGFYEMGPDGILKRMDADPPQIGPVSGFLIYDAETDTWRYEDA